MPNLPSHLVSRTFYLYDASLDDVIHFSIADDADLAPFVINPAKGELEKPNAQDPKRKVALRLAIAEVQCFLFLHKFKVYAQRLNFVVMCLQLRPKPKFPNRTQWGRDRWKIRPQTMPVATPAMSAIQSFRSALRLKLGWISSIIPPKALAPKNIGSSPKRLVLESGKDSAE